VKFKNVFVGILIFPFVALGVRLILPSEFVICKLLLVLVIILEIVPKFKGTFCGILITELPFVLRTKFMLPVLDIIFVSFTEFILRLPDVSVNIEF
jgi:hypothetical protein